MSLNDNYVRLMSENHELEKKVKELETRLKKYETLQKLAMELNRLICEDISDEVK